MRDIALISRKIYTAGTNFTRPLVVTVATNLNSGSPGVFSNYIPSINRSVLECGWNELFLTSYFNRAIHTNLPCVFPVTCKIAVFLNLHCSFRALHSGLATARWPIYCADNSFFRNPSPPAFPGDDVICCASPGDRMEYDVSIWLWLSCLSWWSDGWW